MRPIDFVLFDGDSSPNVPAHKVSEAMMKPLIIRTDQATYSVLSYYLTNEGLVLDIEKEEI